MTVVITVILMCWYQLISVVNICYCVIVIEERTSSEKLDVSVDKQRILTVYDV